MFTKGLTLSSEAKYYLYSSLRERLQLPEQVRNGVASGLRDALAYFVVLALKTWKAKKVAIQVCGPLSQGGAGAGTGDGQRS